MKSWHTEVYEYYKITIEEPHPLSMIAKDPSFPQYGNPLGLPEEWEGWRTLRLCVLRQPWISKTA
jgi:hypothetical protein